MGTDVVGKLPGEVTIVIENELECMNHDAHKLHHLQCGQVLLPPEEPKGTQKETKWLVNSSITMSCNTSPWKAFRHSLKMLSKFHIFMGQNESKFPKGYWVGQNKQKGQKGPRFHIPNH